MIVTGNLSIDNGRITFPTWYLLDVEERCNLLVIDLTER